MPFTIPQPIRLLPGGAKLPVLSSLSFREPVEGKAFIPVEIDWSGAGESYDINVRGLTTQTFSQIVMLDVDNTQSGAPVTFYFPDSLDTLVIPGESGGLFPVFTRALEFYASAPQALASDVTRFRILNYRQEPIDLPPPEPTTVAAAVGLTSAGTTNLLAGKSGTLIGYSLNFTGQASASAASGFQGVLQDHATSAVIDQANAVAFTNGFVFGVLLNVTNVAIRFSNGIDFIITNTGSAWVSEVANLTLRYRQP